MKNNLDLVITESNKMNMVSGYAINLNNLNPVNTHVRTNVYHQGATKNRYLLCLFASSFYSFSLLHPFPLSFLLGDSRSSGFLKLWIGKNPFRRRSYDSNLFHDQGKPAEKMIVVVILVTLSSVLH